MFQRNSSTSSLLKLKGKEFKSKQTCRCKGFCKKEHLKPNYFKSEADELCDRMNKISKENKEHFQNLETLSKCLIYSLCKDNFLKKNKIKNTLIKSIKTELRKTHNWTEVFKPKDNKVKEKYSSQEKIKGTWQGQS